MRFWCDWSVNGRERRGHNHSLSGQHYHRFLLDPDITTGDVIRGRCTLTTVLYLHVKEVA